METPLNLVLVSGTDDRLGAAAVLAAGAAALGRPVNILLTYSALDAFRKDRIGDVGLSADAPASVAKRYSEARQSGMGTWADNFAAAKDIGEVKIIACSLSMDFLKLEESDLSPLVDEVAGVTGFFLDAGEGSITVV